MIIETAGELDRAVVFFRVSGQWPDAHMQMMLSAKGQRSRRSASSSSPSRLFQAM